MIRLATTSDLKLLSPLFDGYRIFYKQESDLEAATAFLAERLKNIDSVIFVYEEGGELIGFTQLYPIFSSVTMERMDILNDLFVSPDHRGRGVGKALLDHAKAYAKMHRLKGLQLCTGYDNPAQHLYESEGWQKETDLFYFWKNKE